ncbi:MAG: Crp/Fnr family transcriptional regulator, partial [Bradymonadaceae bacterium]
AVFDEMDYPAGAVALDETLVLQIHRSHFLGTLREEPTLMEAVLRNMMVRNFQLVRRLHDVTVSGAERRLARLFDNLAYSTGIRKQSDDGSTYIFIPMPLSRQDLAQLINTRPETAIRLMSKWRDEEIMETTDEGFEVYEPDELKDIAGTGQEDLSLPVL